MCSAKVLFSFDFRRNFGSSNKIPKIYQTSIKCIQTYIKDISKYIQYKRFWETTLGNLPVALQSIRRMEQGTTSLLHSCKDNVFGAARLAASMSQGIAL